MPDGVGRGDPRIPRPDGGGSLVPSCDVQHHHFYQILLSLTDNDQLYQSELESEIPSLSRRIWMLVEHGHHYQPLGQQILSVDLVVTLESARRHRNRLLQ